MAGLGKFMKEAAKMQKRIEAIQEELAKEEIEVSSGGGAVVVRITGQGEFVSVKLDPEFLKEDAGFVSETVLGAVKEAAAKAKALNEDKMRGATSGFAMPGML